MRKYVFSLCLLLISVAVMGQKKSIVNLISSKSSTGIKINGKDLIKVYQGTFKQDYSNLSSDSAYFYPQDNAFDAFGHVVINQGDTLHIYGDKLNYNGNTKIAILTDNVKMVDKDATLTTNHLTYNTATRIGVYTEGGKLVNKDNTLRSKNGYYFAFTRDSYFRYNVSLTTPDALILTDTMRYNTGSKIAYFYGPTNIYGTKSEKGQKDKDTLYTENGTYNTTTEQAAFGKNNLYKSGTKSLKGDSLFYDKLKGYGRAVKHVTFIDLEQKTTIKGNLGTYFKADERTLVTQDPYIILVTEEKDTTKTDSAAKADSIKNAKAGSKKTINMNELIKKTMPSKTDTLGSKEANIANTVTQLIKQRGGEVSPPTLTAAIDTALKHQPQQKDIPKDEQIENVLKLQQKNIPQNIQAQVDSAKKNSQSQAKVTGKTTTLTLKTGKTTDAKTSAKADKESASEKIIAKKDTGRMKRDSIFISADTIETQIMTYKDLKIYNEKARLAHMRDTTSKPKKIKPKVSNEKESKFLTATYIIEIPKDTSYLHRLFFGRPKPPPVKKPKPLTKKQIEQDSLRKKFLSDSTDMAKKLEPSDTARIRIMIAHHHAKLFKSDLQAKADSMFYSNADSTIHCFVSPLMWTEGSQLSGDTINLQMKHKKLDNMRLFLNAFIVNIEKTDSVHFNQVGGKRMQGFFKDDKLSRMYVNGNAESIYFQRDSATNKVSGMQRSLSSRIRADFKNNEAIRLSLYVKPENRYTPIEKVKEDDKILKGFIWKPKERPISKESILPSHNKKAVPAVKKPDAADKTKTTGKPGGKAIPGKATVKDSTSVKKPGGLPALKAGKDSVMKKDTSKVAPPKTTTDTAKKVAPVKKPADM